MGREVVQLVVDDRVFLLGLDQHYREAMKRFEAEVMLGRAEALAARLGVHEADVPLEGYYADPIPGLARYFRLMRSLQGVTEEEGEPARAMPELERILEITGSALYGRPIFERNNQMMMLPTGRDPLSQALQDFSSTPDLCTVAGLAARAREATVEYDDISLVGLAAFAGDAIALAALRESVVLYAEKVIMVGGMPTYEYVWRVDSALAVRANRFIALFNRLVAPSNAYAPIPSASADNAGHFYGCWEDTHILGRCVHLATRLDTMQMYHWAIRISLGRPRLEVHEFWSPDLWTTERYRAEHGLRAGGAPIGAPPVRQFRT